MRSIVMPSDAQIASVVAAILSAEPLGGGILLLSSLLGASIRGGIMNNVLFVCWGFTDGLSHWRSLVPQRAMGAGLVCFNETGKPVISDLRQEQWMYEVAVVQTCWYDWQRDIIEALRRRGMKIILNVDDYIKGIGRRAKGTVKGQMWHDFTKKDVQANHVRILESADGILASTPVLADKLRKHNEVRLAPNGIDLDRYAPWRDPVRDDGLIFGWAGGVGHTDVIREIAPSVRAAISDLNDEGIKTKLCVVGQDNRDEFGMPDALYMRWADKMIYPQYLSCFDISLAPSRDDSFFRYKSQLRLYEAAALGTPTLGGPLYDEMDGFGTICRDDWYDRIMEYGRSEQLRNDVRQFCYDNIGRFTIEERIGTWAKSIQNLTGSSISVESPHSSKSSNETDKIAT